MDIHGPNIVRDINVEGTATIGEDLHISTGTFFVNQGTIRSTGTNIILNSGSEVQMVVDEYDIFSAQGLHQRFGPSSGATVEVDNSGFPTFVKIYGENNNYLEVKEDGGGNGNLKYYDNNTEVLSIDDEYARIGTSNNARLIIDNSGDPTVARLYGGDDNYLEIEQDAGGGFTFRYYESGTEVMKIDDTSVRLGTSPNDYAKMNYSNHSFDIYDDGDRVFHAFTNEQILGVSGESRIEVKQFNDTVDMYVGSLHFLSATTTVQTFGDPVDTRIVLNQSTNTVTIYGNNGTSGVFNETGPVELYYNGSKVAETTASGITGAVWG